MPRKTDAKLRLLYIKDYLYELTDENHPLFTADIKKKLEDDYEITADRRSIYSDVEILGRSEMSDDEEENEEDDFRETYGLDIRKKRKGYYLATRDFNLQEIKLLVDMVESSSNIPNDMAKSLVEKLRNQVSVYDRKYLQRHVEIRNQVKTLNDQFQGNADKIFDAINGDKNVRFQYFSYRTDRRKSLRRGGKIYEVSPFALAWVDQNYYMLGYMLEMQEIRSFRVDRMTKVVVGSEYRTGKQEYEKLINGNLPDYINKVFHMYMGEIKTVTMKFDNSLVDTVIDRFGEDIMLHPTDGGHFTCTLEVAVSPQFYGWLAGFGSLAELVAPQDERENMANHLRKALNLYRRKNGL